MSISIVARFLDPAEAEIAAGALRSAGFDAVTMDQNFASVDPLARQSLGGMRVGVPQGEAAEAAQFLHDLAKVYPKTPAPILSGTGWRLTAAVLGFLHPVFGWLAVSVSNRARRSRPLPLIPAMLLALGAVAAAGLLLTGLIELVLQWADPRL